MKTILLLGIILFPSLAFAIETQPSSLDYSGPAWSPYVVGLLIGILSCLIRYFSGKAIGASTSYAMGAGMISEKISKEHTDSLTYFQDNPPKANWEFLFVVAAIFGAFVAAWNGGEFSLSTVPAMWQDRFAGGTGSRIASVFFGGILMAFGARLAGGCTSGHGISGTQELSVGSWIALVCFFIGGMAVAFPLYL